MSNRSFVFESLSGRTISYVTIDNVLSSGFESTGNIVIKFTDGSEFAISECAQTGYMEFHEFSADEVAEADQEWELALNQDKG